MNVSMSHRRHGTWLIQHVFELSHIYEWVMSRVSMSLSGWISNGTFVNAPCESCHIYECVMSQVAHVPQELQWMSHTHTSICIQYVCMHTYVYIPVYIYTYIPVYIYVPQENARNAPQHMHTYMDMYCYDMCIHMYVLHIYVYIYYVSL